MGSELVGRDRELAELSDLLAGTQSHGTLEVSRAAEQAGTAFAMSYHHLRFTLPGDHGLLTVGRGAVAVVATFALMTAVGGVAAAHLAAPAPLALAVLQAEQQTPVAVTRRWSFSGSRVGRTARRARAGGARRSR